MPNWLNEFLIAIGGGSIATVGIVVIIKAIIGKIVDIAVEKSTIKFTNKLERSTKAYEILLDKEFECYEKVGIHLATLVSLIQDLHFWTLESLKNNSESTKKKHKEFLLNYLRIIQILKNDVVRFQLYVPKNVLTTLNLLVQCLQEKSRYFGDVSKIMFENSEDNIDEKEMNDTVSKLLTLIDLVEASIKDRLMELTKN